MLIGDGETAEGSVWEAAQVAAHHKLDNLCAITDVNGYGQSRATQWDRDTEAYVVALARVRLARDRRSTGTTCRRSWPRSPTPAAPRGGRR